MNSQEELIFKYLNDEASDLEVETLFAWIQESEEHAQQFARLAFLHSNLRGQLLGEANLRAADEVEAVDESKLEAASSSPAIPPGQRHRMLDFLIQPTTLSIGVAATVIGLLIAVMAFIVPGNDQDFTGAPVINPVADITGIHETVWAGQEVDYLPDTALLPGRVLHLERGLAEISYRDGGKVLLQGPVTFVIGNPSISSGSGELGELKQGKLTALLEGLPPGHAVRLPWGKVVHVGTEFGLSLNKERETNVEVVSGEVELYSHRQRDTTSGFLRLHAGEYAWISANAEVDSARGDEGAEPFVWHSEFASLAGQHDRVIGHWKFDDVPTHGPGRVAVGVADSSGRKHPLQWYSGNASYHASSNFDGGRGASFDVSESIKDDSILFVAGSEDTRGQDHSPDIYSRFALRDFMVDGYFRTNAAGRGDVVSYGDRLKIYTEDGRLFFQAGNGQAIVGSGELSSGSWHYFSAKCEADGPGNRLTLTVRKPDGQTLKAIAEVGALASPSRNFCLGGDVYAKGHPFDGQIDEVRFLQIIRPSPTH